MGVGVSPTTRPPLPLGKTRFTLYRRLGASQGRPGQVRKISPPPGFDLRTVNTVASRYTDYTIRPTICDTHTTIACHKLMGFRSYISPPPQAAQKYCQRSPYTDLTLLGISLSHRRQAVS